MKSHLSSPEQLFAQPVPELKKLFLDQQRAVPDGLLEWLETDPRRGARELARAIRARQKKRCAEEQRLRRLLQFESELRARGFNLIAGVDEVGRGALAGPVAAAAVVLDPTRPLPEGLNDSKKLTAPQRERIAAELRETALCYAVALVPAGEIDRTNILVATRRAMCDALSQLCPAADFALIDALQLRDLALPQRAIIRGDACSASIAAASIVAKTYRDALMRDYHREFPQYGFESHVGYGAPAHLAALRAHGPCPIHRRSFRGVLCDAAAAPADTPIIETTDETRPAETTPEGDESAGGRAG